jgi:hypothetical protein
MKLTDYFWPDSNIDKIIIEFNKLEMIVLNDALKKKMLIVCNNFIGIDNFCIWDDTIIYDLTIQSICKNELYKISMLNNYDFDENYGERFLSDGILDISVILTNNVKFHIYCQNVQVDVIDD